MSQRTTIGGEEYEVLHVSRFDDDIGSVLGGTHLCHLRKVEKPNPYHAYHEWCDCPYCSAIRQAKPAPKESERLWREYENDMNMQGYDSARIARQLRLDRRLADAIKAEIREELPEMLKPHTETIMTEVFKRLDWMEQKKK